MEEFGEVFSQVEKINTIPFENYNTILQASVVSIFTKLKIDNPKLTQGQICQMMKISPSTLTRIRKDLDMSSPYRHRIPQKKKTSNNPQGHPQSKISSGIPSNIPTATVFSCDNCNQVCKSKTGLAVHKRSCDKSAKGGVDVVNHPDNYTGIRLSYPPNSISTSLTTQPSQLQSDAEFDKKSKRHAF